MIIIPSKTPNHIRHHFACACAERALSFIENPDPRSLEALRVKRLWIEGKATDEELEKVKQAAIEAYAASASAAAAAAAAAAAVTESDAIHGVDYTSYAALSRSRFSDAERKKEKKWQQNKLEEMIREYEELRRQLIVLLSLKKQTVAVAAIFKPILEGVLFEVS